MAHVTQRTDERIDPTTEGKAKVKISAKRKAKLASIPTPLDTLDALGVYVGHKTFSPENATEFPTTATFENGTRVHLHQEVCEDMDDGFGNFGNIEDDDDIIWTVVDLTDETVELTVPGDWGKRRHVDYSEFAENYEPLFLADGQPQWGY